MQLCESKKSKLSGVTMGAILVASIFASAGTRSYAITTGSHQATGFGANVTVGSVVKLGKVAEAQFPSCNTQNIGSFTASAASVNLAGLVSTGVVNSTASSTATSSTGTNEVEGISVLDGLITADSIKAVSTSLELSPHTFGNSAAGTNFANLKVLGIPISANVAPNTEIDLPLIGSVTINEQTSYITSDEASFAVNMIHVKITLGANKGTDIIVAGANSLIKLKTVPALVGGYAYAPQLVTKTVSSGPLVYYLIPCFGTGGAIESDTVASTNIPGVVSTGVVTVTGEGNIVGEDAESQATSSIAGLNLLSGLVSVSAIDAVASGTTADGTNFDFTGGSTFVGISVAGHPEIKDEVAQNTKINVLNLGTLYINRVQHYTDKIKIVPIELIVNTTNTLGLPIGADLTLGAVEAQLHSAAIP